MLRQNHYILPLQASIEPWAQEGKQNLKNSMDQLGNSTPKFKQQYIYFISTQIKQAQLA